MKYQYSHIQSNPSGYATTTGPASSATSVTQAAAAFIASAGSRPSASNRSRSRPLTASAAGTNSSLIGFSSA